MRGRTRYRRVHRQPYLQFLAPVRCSWLDSFAVDDIPSPLSRCCSSPPAANISECPVPDDLLTQLANRFALGFAASSVSVDSMSTKAANIDEEKTLLHAKGAKSERHCRSVRKSPLYQVLGCHKRCGPGTYFHILRATEINQSLS